MTNYFDKKNQETYEKNTFILVSAINKIKQNPNLKATISELVKITGLHRNTIRNRGWVKDKLNYIKTEKKNKLVSRQFKESQIKPEASFEEKYNQLKKELVYWFNSCSTLKNQVEQLTINLHRVSDARRYYEAMLFEERGKVRKLNEHIDYLNLIISKTEE
jgi:hypothetical protein